MEHLTFICIHLNLGRLIQAPVTIIAQRLWQVSTEKGIFAIKKAVSASDALQSETLAKIFADKGLPTIAATFYDDYLIYPWQPGQVLSTEAAAPDYCYAMGSLLAHLHLANVHLPAIKTAHWHNFQLNDWLLLQEISREKKLISLVKPLLAMLDLRIEKYFVAQSNLTHTLVISHGDLTQANIIWKNITSPLIIDWESAGWLHPQIELIGVLFNWSGINVGTCRQESVTPIIQGYQAVGGEININENTLWASLNSWFAWLLFNMRECVLNNKPVEVEIVHTLKILQQMPEAFTILLQGLSVK